jgi:hypothetical protein
LDLIPTMSDEQVDHQDGPQDTSQRAGLGIAFPCAVIIILLILVPAVLWIRHRRKRRQRYYEGLGGGEGDWYPSPPRSHTPVELEVVREVAVREDGRVVGQEDGMVLEELGSLEGGGGQARGLQRLPPGYGMRVVEEEELPAYDVAVAQGLPKK